MRPPVPSSFQHSTRILRLLPRAPQNPVPRRIVTTSGTNAAPVDIPKLVVSPGSSHHNSLRSFLDYASRTKLLSDRTVYIGTHYEYISQLSLQRLGFSLLRTGRRNDAGIDLVGHWVLPPLREPLPVIIQCKARKIACSPSHVRELEGSFQGIPPGWRKKDVLGLLVSTQTTTKGVFDALCSSRWPLGFMKISVDGTIEQFVWNRAASEKGLEGVGATVRHTPRISLPEAQEQGAEEGIITEDALKKGKKSARKLKIAGTKQDIQLTWMGSPLFAQRNELDPETLKLMGHLQISEESKAVNEDTTDSDVDGGALSDVDVTPKAPMRRRVYRTKRDVLGEIKKKRGRPLGAKNKKKGDRVPNG